MSETGSLPTSDKVELPKPVTGSGERNHNLTSITGLTERVFFSTLIVPTGPFATYSNSLAVFNRWWSFVSIFGHNRHFIMFIILCSLFMFCHLSVGLFT